MTTTAVKNSFSEWIHATGSRRPLVAFRITFATVWLAYDAVDLAVAGTQGSLWSSPDPLVHRNLLWTQLVLIVSELGLLLGWRPWAFALIACLARAYEAFLFPLNDFFYFCVTALILAQCDCASDFFEKRSEKAQVWPRDVMVLQTAWIYATSALLKMSPSYLSGGDLYVRQNYLSSVGWPYPTPYLRWVNHLSTNAGLALLSIIGEFSLAALLFSWWRWPSLRSKVRPLAIFLAIGIHGFAGIFLNVFFFGLSLIAQVSLMTWEPEGSRLRQG